MDFLDEAHLGFHRLEVLIDRDEVWLTLRQGGKRDRARAEAWLAFLGWTIESFLWEAYPEVMGA